MSLKIDFIKEVKKDVVDCFSGEDVYEYTANENITVLIHVSKGQIVKSYVMKAYLPFDYNNPGQCIENFIKLLLLI